ncbi:spatacsin [Topomyia yanbarensis]|uniref:spatacsin n=1 Tax=Topomyia yanbarensis TaxID=2498891 RepID=UPI00273BD2F1|nr:spatacsin [Topomyia yanbarensis]
MPPEKDIITKGWEKLDDDVIIKEVATKGKHVKLCIAYLAERNELSHTEARDYFLQKANAYVHRLLSNRQLYKAEHILTNIDWVSKYVFYQIAAETSDHDLRDYIREHLVKTIENYGGESGEERLIEANWKVYCLLKDNVRQLAELLRELDSGYSVLEIETMTFNTFYAKDEAYRNAVALDLFFKNQETEISPLLDKYAVWNYLLKNNIDNLIKIWIQINACLRSLPELARNPSDYSTDLAKIKIDIYDDPRFNERLRQLFRRWEINDFMVSQLSCQKNMCRNEVLLNALATYGKFVDHERTDSLQILRRLFTTQTLEANRVWLEGTDFREGLTRHLVNERLFQLMDLPVVSKECLRKVVNDSNCDKRKEVEMFLLLNDLKNESINKEKLRNISIKCSEYLASSQENFYDENPIVYLFEYFLDPNNTQFPEDTERFRKLPHLYNFLTRLKTNPTSSVSVASLLELHDLPSVGTIRNHLFGCLDDDDEDEEAMNLALLQTHGCIPHFAHPVLCAKYGSTVKLNYLHYIKQYRSSYALYLFYLEQLQCYSRITPSQINCAAKSVAEIAVANFRDANLVTHCVAFIEMLGVDSMRTRAYVRCLNMIQTTNTPTKISVRELLQRCEDVVVHKEWGDPDLLLDLEAMIILCRTSRLKFPERYLLRLLEENNWFRFLLLVEYLDYPQEQILELCISGFGDRTVGNNVMRAIKYYVEPVQRRASTPSSQRKRSITTPKRRRKVSNSQSSVSSETDSRQYSQSTICESEYDGSRFLCERYDQDLFATILLCSNEAKNCTRAEITANRPVRDFDGFRQLVLATGTEISTKHPSTFANLLYRAIRRKWPLLAVLAGMVSESNRKFCWLTWLMISVEYPYEEVIADVQETDFLGDILQYCVRMGFVQILHDSIAVFFPESNFFCLVKYFVETMATNFSQSTTDYLRQFLQHADDFELLGFEKHEKQDLIICSVKLLTLHLDHNFDSLYYQIQLLESLVASDIGYFTQDIDFALLLKISNIIRDTTIRVNFIDYFNRTDNLNPELEKLCERLVAAKFHKEAIELADLLDFPKESIIFEHWSSTFESSGICSFDQYHSDMTKYNFGPELLLNFYIHIANQLEYSDSRKYTVLKTALELIKDRGLYPSEVFDRDRLEYELVQAYVQCTEDPSTLELYHSHFFTNIYVRDRCILHHTFLELKEVAGIDDLTVSNLRLIDPDEVIRLDGLINRLLEKGDIVQALRYQAIFDQRPVDLHFIVFCMALAESLVSLYNLSKEERLMLNEDYKRAANRFQRRTLRSTRISQSSANTSLCSPLKPAHNDSSDTSAAASEFEEVPSREKQNIFEAINSLGAKIKYGQELAQRIVLTYRVAMHLDKEYNEILKIRDPVGLLGEVIQEECIQKLEVVSDIMTSHRLENSTVSEFLAREIVTAVVRSKFYLLQHTSSMANSKPIEELLWGYNIDREFHLFLELAPNTTMLGTLLLRYCDSIKHYKRLEKSPESRSLSSSTTEEVDFELLEQLRIIFKGQILSLKKQNTIIVALLIKAHDCFVHECSVEGIVQVLQRCKALNSILTGAKSWSLIVKLLVGIGRYREMYYCFETLIKHDQFESLLGQFEERHTNGLKAAIISYLHEHCPDRKEYFRLAALHFMMYKETAEMYETEAKSTIALVLSTHERTPPSSQAFNSIGGPKVIIPRLECTTLVVSVLNTAMEAYMHAAENYLLDNKMSFAQRTASYAELVALQICMINQVLDEKAGSNDSHCISILNIKKDEKGSNLAYYVNNVLSVPQALIIARNYDYEINWTAALYQHFIVNGEAQYLEDYLDRMPLTDVMVEHLVKTFQLEPCVTPEMERAIAGLVKLVESVTLKYRLASLLGLKRTLHELINENSLYYLKDCDYGRNEHTASGS